jgi:hypothetical protein
MICPVSVHVFVDESRRGSTYLLAAAILEPGQLTPTRVLLRGLRMPGERKVHFKHERDAVQKDIAARLVDARLQGRIYHGQGPDEAIRAACLSRLVDDALAEGCTRLVLDTRGENGDRADLPCAPAARRRGQVGVRAPAVTRGPGAVDPRCARLVPWSGR